MREFQDSNQNLNFTTVVDHELGHFNDLQKQVIVETYLALQSYFVNPNHTFSRRQQPGVSVQVYVRKCSLSEKKTRILPLFNN